VAGFSDGISVCKKTGQRIIEKLLLYINEGFLLREAVVPEEQKRETSLVSLVNSAYRDWEISKALFEEVYDPELVDHAIYAMKAAEQKYIYLLNLAKKENVQNEGFHFTSER
jgi:hypothetical protein